MDQPLNYALDTHSKRFVSVMLHRFYYCVQLTDKKTEVHRGQSNLPMVTLQKNCRLVFKSKALKAMRFLNKRAALAPQKLTLFKISH